MELICCGKIVNTHGLKGDLKVVSDSDFKEDRFKKGSTLYIEYKNEMIKVTVKSYKDNNGTDLVTFVDLEDINSVEKYKGCNIYVDRSELKELEEDEFYYFELIGCSVYSEEDVFLGKIERIMETGANDVWIIKGENGKNILIPYISQIVKNVDIVNKKIIIHVMEGLLD